MESKRLNKYKTKGLYVLETLERAQTKDYIAGVIRDEIYRGKIKDGEKLKQSEVANAMGVSRMPVREAFQMLEMEGVLEKLSNRHVKVNGINLESANAQFRMIKALEKEICVIIMEKGVSIAPLEKIVEDYKEKLAANDKEECRKIELNFHHYLSASTNISTIRQAHQKMLAGYFTFAIENYDFDFEKNKTFIENIHQHIVNNDLDKLTEEFDHYFLYYSDVLRKELEVLDHE